LAKQTASLVDDVDVAQLVFGWLRTGL